MKIINKYNIIEFILAAIVTVIVVIKLPNDILENDFIDIPKEYIVIAVLGYIFYIFFQNALSVNYKDATGRCYSKDKNLYHRTYNSLKRYFKPNKEHQLDTSHYEKVSWKDAEGIILGKSKDKRLINIPSGKDGKNILIFGLPGIGKTAGPIICSCLRFGMFSGAKEALGSVFCIDLKGDIYNATHSKRKIKRINLINPDDGCHFDPLAGVEHMTIEERCNLIENIGYTIIPQGATGNEKYFSQTAEDYFNAIALYMLDKDIKTDFSAIVKAILDSNPIDWVLKVIEDGPIEAKHRIASKKGENEKNLAGGYSLLATNCRLFASEKVSKIFKKGNNLSVQTLEDGSDVYVTLNQEDLTVYSPVLSMIVQAFLNGFLARERNPRAGRLLDGSLRPVLFVLDEFAQLSRLRYEAIASAFMTLRSKRVSILCALQSKSSISSMFHSETAAKALIDNISTFTFLSIQEVETRKWASDLIGKERVLKLSNNTAGSKSSRNYSEAEEYIIQPEEFGYLKDSTKDEVVIYTNGKYIVADKVYYYM